VRIASVAAISAGVVVSLACVRLAPARGRVEAPRAKEAPILGNPVAAAGELKAILRDGQLPPVGAVRAETLLNELEASTPTEGRGIAAWAEISPVPWSKERLVRVVVQAPDERHRAPRAVTVAVDVSGSMAEPSRLPLLRRALVRFARELGPGDRLSVLACGSKPRIEVPWTSGAGGFARAIEALAPGGSSDLAACLRLGRRLGAGLGASTLHKLVLATDSPTPPRLPADQGWLRAKDVELSVVRLGAPVFERAAGNSPHHFADDEPGIVRVLRRLLRPGPVIARDLELEIEAAGEARVRSVDSPLGADRALSLVGGGPLRAGERRVALFSVDGVGDLGRIAFRYRSQSRWESRVVAARVAKRFDQASSEQGFATAVWAFSQLLRDGARNELRWSDALDLAVRSAAGHNDPARRELVDLVRIAAHLYAEPINAM